MHQPRAEQPDAAASPLAPRPLDYGAAPAQASKWVRRSALAFVLLATIASAWKWGPGAWRHARVLYWQNRCLNFTAPADQVVYEEEPNAAALLLKSNPQYAAYPLNRHAGPDGSKSIPVPVKAAAFVPRAWDAFYPNRPTLGLSPAGVPRAVIFLHELTSPAGHRRLVCVEYFPDTDTFTPGFVAGFNFCPTVTTLATLRSDMSLKGGGFVVDVMSGWPRSAPKLRVFAGQADPSNPAHFTVRYQMWGQEDVADGYLNDQDMVTLTPRNQIVEMYHLP